MLLGFKKRFAPNIINGSKIHTLRNARKVEPKIGELLYMYTGLRTRNCELIRKDLTLKSIQQVEIVFYWGSYDRHGNEKESESHHPVIWVDHEHLTDDQINDFFVNDGFKDESDFVNFWDLKKGSDVVAELQMFHWTDFVY